MAKTAVANTRVITLQPTGVGSNTIALNPVFTTCDPTNGNYFVTSGRDLLTMYCLPVADAVAWNVSATYTVGSVVQFAGASATITNVVIATNIATLTATNTFTIGAPVTITGLTTATYLNNQTVIVTASSGTTFTFTFSHSDVSTADSGTARIPAGNFISTAASVARMPGTTAFWDTYADGDSTVSFFSAPDACTGRTSDVDDYAVPNVATVPQYSVPFAGGLIEFQILPSSVFTQTDGSFQFLASSNLVQVAVSSL